MTVWNKTSNGSWTKINSIFNKTSSGGWTEIRGVWIKTASSIWTRVFTRLLVPANTVKPDVTGTYRLYATLTGSLGTWSSPDGTTITYSRQWQRSTPVGTPPEPGSWSNIAGATTSQYPTVLADDGKFIRVNVTATNSSGPSTAASFDYLITKYTPVSLLAPTITGTASVGQFLTTSPTTPGVWKTTTINSGDTSPDTYSYEWIWGDTGASIGSNQNTYTVQPTDVGHTIKVRVTATNTGGSTTSVYSNATAQIIDPYVFSFGKTLHVGTNGYISLDLSFPNSVDAISSTSGQVIGILPADLQQSSATSIWYWSDTNQFIIKWEGYVFNQPSVIRQYEIIFNKNLNYARVYIINATSGSGTQAFVKDGVARTSYASGLVTGNLRDVYFDGQTPPATVFTTYTPMSKSLMKQVTGLTSGSTDVGYTSIVTSINQTAPNLTAPTISLISTGNVSSPLSVYFSGGSGPFYQIFWWGTASPPTGQVTPDATGSSSPLTDNTGPSSTATQYMYVRSVATANEVSLGPSPIASAWSSGVAFNMTQAKLSTPTGVSATDTRTDGVNITWNAVSGASYYGIWWGGAPGYDSSPDFGGPNNAGGWNGISTSFLDTGISAGTSRDYYVQAFASNNPAGTKSDWGGPDNGTRSNVTPPATPAITSGPGISWASGNNFTLSASASNATNLEFQVEFANNNGGPALSTQTFFFGASTGGGTTGAQQYSWARTRVRANNSTTGLSSSFSAFTGWA
jgi:hypothetical protein